MVVKLPWSSLRRFSAPLRVLRAGSASMPALRNCSKRRKVIWLSRAASRPLPMPSERSI